jgi:hypothetical protein
LSGTGFFLQNGGFPASSEGRRQAGVELHRAELGRKLRSADLGRTLLRAASDARRRTAKGGITYMLRAVRLVVFLLLALLAGCGGSGSGAGDGEDPAAAVPANAPFYMEASARPEGDTREHALDALGKILQTDDPQAKIDELVDKAFAESDEPKVTYEKDIKPWLGEKIGFWLASAEQNGDDTKFAAIFSSTDPDEAQKLVDRGVKEGDEKFTKHSYKGEDYQVNGDGIAVAVLDEYVIVGTENELKQSIAAADGDSLADADRYTDPLDDLPDERLASFYFDIKTLFDQALKADPEAAQQLQQLRGTFAFDKIGPITGAFTADGDKLAVDTSVSSGADAIPGITGAGSSKLLGRLPGDSWAAYAIPKFGQSVKEVYGKLAGALGGAAIEGQLRQQLGIDLQQDVFSWIGDVAFFVRGTHVDDVGGGAVIQVTDDAKAKAAFGKLIGLLRTQGGVNAQPVRVEGAEQAFEVRQPGVPKPIVFARGSDKAVIAYGAEAASEALEPSDTLADSETYHEAESLLGDDIEPSFLLSVPPIVTLAGEASAGDPDFEKAKPYLDAFGTTAIGGEVSGDRAHSRAVVGLK